MSNFTITKTTSSDVLFILHPLSNPLLSKVISLTDRTPKQNLPGDWALGVFTDSNLYYMYKKGYFTFNDNEGLVKLAIENNVYFDEVLDFTPAKESTNAEVLAVLKAGNRNNILKAIDKYGEEKVKEVAISNVQELTNGVTSMLENLWKISLTIG